MSWFDASGFASLAKSALKEAQKTIDKALDIKDEEQKATQAPSADVSDFFETWGLKNEGPPDEKSDLTSQKNQTSSIWGSFTGSFFENPKGDEEGIKTMKHSKSFQESLEDNIQEPHVPSSLSVPESLVSEYSESSSSKNETEDSICSGNLLTSKLNSASSNSALQTSSELYQDDKTRSLILEKSEIEKKDSKPSSEIEKRSSDVKKTELQADYCLKRISVISCESDKRSSESVEILGSQPSTDCTTTPESEVNSVSQSLSPSFPDTKFNSESVEILPDSSVTSPSSVEVLGDWKSDSSPFLSPVEQKHFKSSSCDRASSAIDVLENESCSDISPYESPMEEAKTISVSSCSESKSRGPSPNIMASLMQKDSESTSKISPDSVEVIPDVDESDEISLAEDSYTSASESTVMTIMETFQQVDQAKAKKEFSESNLKMLDSFADSSHLSMNSSAEYPLNVSLDSIKEKHNLHLPLEPITTQPIRKTEYLESAKNISELDPFEQLKSLTIEPSEHEDYPESTQNSKTENPEGPDQYLMLTDSSCEGTLIESSSEDNATLANTEPKINEAPLTTSSYVKSLLADAMYEKSDNSDTERHCMDVPRENSPISSER